MKAHLWSCVSGVSCLTSFISASLPAVQWIAAVVSIAAGAKALWPWAQVQWAKLRLRIGL